MKSLIYTVILNCICIIAFAQKKMEISGLVKNTQYEIVKNATITIKGTSEKAQTNDMGEFSFYTTSTSVILEVNHIGYRPFNTKLSLPLVSPLKIILNTEILQLEEVQVSTGYQKIPKERATGSFEQLDGKLINRSVSSDILGRIEGFNASTLFDKRGYNYNASESRPNIILRGINTINAGTGPLIILDNFPFHGDINTINPNDISDITILKDASAASIWGASAGNGVIVISTKKGKLNLPLRISFNASSNVTGKPDLMAYNTISSDDFIDLEQTLFSKGFYTTQENNVRKPALTPAVELMIAQRDGKLSASELQVKLNELKSHDVRNDYLSRVYRNSVNQQYALNFSGGGSMYAYYVSGGYDKGLQSLKSNNNDRITFRVENMLKPIERLEIKASLQYNNNNISSLSINAGMGYGQLKTGPKTLYPYASLLNSNGGASSIEKDFRSIYTNSIGGGNLLDWNYRPLDELDLANNQSISSGLIMDASANYRIAKWMSAEIKYQYQQSDRNGKDFKSVDSYYTRNLINLYTQINGSQVIRPIPLGGIMDISNSNVKGQAIRGQLNFNNVWDKNNEFSAIAGAEIRNVNSVANNYRTYGYNDDLLTYNNVDFISVFPAYNNLASSSSISSGVSFDNILNRYVSIYANGAYTYSRRYTVSASIRKDASNLFGVKTNQKGVPLWSTGLLWNISNEHFYDLKWLPSLKLRSSFGYSGNVDNSRSAYTTMQYFAAPNTINNLIYGAVLGPPNESLRWEKVRTFNVGIDFFGLSGWLNGSFDYYQKKTTDLLGSELIDPTSGFTRTTLNGASTKGNGWELQLNSTNLKGKINWITNLLISHSTTKISAYGGTTTTTGLVTTGSSINPVIGYDVYPLFSYPWAGLDASNGDPIGYVDGKESKDYSTIVSRTPTKDLVYHGSAIPQYNGALRNTFTYNQFSISANITFRAKYYFRRASINYNTLYASGEGHSDYTSRWKQTGDELTTQVPSMIYPAIANRDVFYNNSSITVEKGDHIRLQDVRVSYDIQNPIKTIRNIQFFAYTSNLGILWRANKSGLDPDYGFNNISPSKSFALGLNANF